MAPPNGSGAPTLYHRFGCTRYCHYQYCMVNGTTRKVNPILLFFRLWWCSAPPSGSGAPIFPTGSLSETSGSEPSGLTLTLTLTLTFSLSSGCGGARLPRMGVGHPSLRRAHSLGCLVQRRQAHPRRPRCPRRCSARRAAGIHLASSCLSVSLSLS